MRHTFLITTCLSVCLAALMLGACSIAPDATGTPQIAGIPTFETPEGLLPGKAGAPSEPVPTMKPVAGEPSQEIDTPDLGVNLTIPAEWSSQHSEGLTTIVDGDGSPMMAVGQVFGFSADPDVMTNQMNEYLLNNQFKGNTFTIRENVVNLYGYLVVSGPGIDACEYDYLPVGLSAIAFKFERALCDSGGGLNDTAFAILRSLRYVGPTQ